jgi:hypothetical protein
VSPTIRHVHSYFLFPFSVDKEAVLEDHPEVWPDRRTWFDRLDEWLATAQPKSATLGAWQRAAYTRFDIESEAYQTMVFFHPFVRRVFFDAHDPAVGSQRDESLLNCYEIPVQGREFLLEATDARGRHAQLDLTDLRLFLFANGIGILSIGVEAFDLPLADALWINEMMRKVYPSSGRQIREARTPNRLRVLSRSGEVHIEERFEKGGLNNFHPRLANTITDLLYFADYGKHEYAPVLDERMLAYTYVAVESTEEFRESEEFDILLSRFLYVDRYGDEYRYEPSFTRKQMERHLYRRWAHQGTYYGFTSYSGLTMTSGVFDCDEHSLREGFLIHRMFDTRYYLMAIIALFYRATLLDFAERAALVSKRLYLDQADGRLTGESITLANHLRADFLHFTNYWLFDELANKDEEMEHFLMQWRAYRLSTMRKQTEEEIEKLNASLNEHYQNQSALAVNRLAVSSIVLGAGAVVTGYFGMNFGRDFGRTFFDPPNNSVWHWTMIIAVSVFGVAAVVFAAFLILSNWRDYRYILLPGGRIEANQAHSLRRQSTRTVE